MPTYLNPPQRPMEQCPECDGVKTFVKKRVTKELIVGIADEAPTTFLIQDFPHWVCKKCKFAYQDEEGESLADEVVRSWRSRNKSVHPRRKCKGCAKEMSDADIQTWVESGRSVEEFFCKDCNKK